MLPSFSAAGLLPVSEHAALTHAAIIHPAKFVFCHTMPHNHVASMMHSSSTHTLHGEQTHLSLIPVSLFFNLQTVNPRDSKSAPVFQLETAVSGTLLRHSFSAAGKELV